MFRPAQTNFRYKKLYETQRLVYVVQWTIDLSVFYSTEKKKQLKFKFVLHFFLWLQLSQLEGMLWLTYAYNVGCHTDNTTSVVTQTTPRRHFRKCIRMKRQCQAEQNTELLYSE